MNSALVSSIHVESNALNTWKLNIFLQLLIVEFHFIAIIKIFFDLNLNSVLEI